MTTDCCIGCCGARHLVTQSFSPSHVQLASSWIVRGFLSFPSGFLDFLTSLCQRKYCSGHSTRVPRARVELPAWGRSSVPSSLHSNHPGSLSGPPSSSAPSAGRPGACRPCPSLGTTKTSSKKPAKKAQERELPALPARASAPHEERGAPHGKPCVKADHYYYL